MDSSRSTVQNDVFRKSRAMEIKPIKSERDYRRALREIHDLMDARLNTPEGDRLDVLSTLVEAWEEKRYRIDPANPVEAIRFAMEQRGLTRRDLELLIGSRARVAEVLNAKRTLTLPMIRRLHERLGIPAEALIREVKAPSAA
jgi:HTH-type transcriptional regulator/antitoxin HigA